MGKDGPDVEVPAPEDDSGTTAACEDVVVHAASKIVSASDAEMSEGLMDIISTDHKHPEMFEIQARLLFKRFCALTKAGFSEEQATKIVLRFGLKKDLADD